MNETNFLTQSELIETDFSSQSREVLNGLLRSGLYILSGTSKVGKSLICTSLANAVASGTEFLGKSTFQGRVVYFDNDNYAAEAKSRVLAQNFGSNDSLHYNFKDAHSFHAIISRLKSIDNLHEIVLVIIDCLANLSEFTDTDSFVDNYVIVKNACDFFMNHSICCILIHHAKKGRAVSQDSVLGSKSLTSASTGTIIIDVEDEFSEYGQLKFILRSKKEIIPIKKDENKINWVLDDEIRSDESINKNLLQIINYLIKDSAHCIEGNYEEVCVKMNLELNPAGFSRFLKKNEKILNENHIFFKLHRTSQSRLVVLYYEAENDTNDSNDTFFCTNRNCHSVIEA